MNHLFLKATQLQRRPLPPEPITPKEAGCYTEEVLALKKNNQKTICPSSLQCWTRGNLPTVNRCLYCVKELNRIVRLVERGKQAGEFEITSEPPQHVKDCVLKELKESWLFQKGEQASLGSNIWSEECKRLRLERVNYTIWPGKSGATAELKDVNDWLYVYGFRRGGKHARELRIHGTRESRVRAEEPHNLHV